MSELDEICRSFITNLTTIDENDELTILDEMIEKLETTTNTTELRKYLNKVSFHMNRYHHNFIHDIFEHNIEFDYLEDIKFNADKFRTMWVTFTQNEKMSNDNDLQQLRITALSTFHWIKRSVTEYNEKKENLVEENYDEHDLMEGMEL